MHRPGGRKLNYPKYKSGTNCLSGFQKQVNQTPQALMLIKNTGTYNLESFSLVPNSIWDNRTQHIKVLFSMLSETNHNMTDIFLKTPEQGFLKRNAEIKLLHLQGNPMIQEPFLNLFPIFTISQKASLFLGSGTSSSVICRPDDISLPGFDAHIP